MKCLERNKKTIHYALYVDKTKILDGNGYFTGEYSNVYSVPTELKGVVSRSVGQSAEEIFGTGITYDATLSVDDMACPIDKDSILWLDASTTSPNDFVVVRKGESLNCIVYALRSVDYVSQTD